MYSEVIEEGVDMGLFGFGADLRLAFGVMDEPREELGGFALGTGPSSTPSYTRSSSSLTTAWLAMLSRLESLLGVVLPLRTIHLYQVLLPARASIISFLSLLAKK